MGDGRKSDYYYENRVTDEKEPSLVERSAQRVVTKDSNPKDSAGSTRIDPSLVSPIAIAEEALAMEEGRTKYGAYNYTVVGVKSRTYIGAAMRHMFKWLLGEERDPMTGVHHLASVRACMGILIDAQSRGKLIDDRPPSLRDASAQLNHLEARVSHVRRVFNDYNPRHYTIEDTEHGQRSREQTDRGGAQAAPAERAQGKDAQPLPGRDR